MIFVISSTHLYPLNNPYLKKTKKVDRQIITKDIKNIMFKFLDQNILPSNVSFYGDLIESFTIFDEKSKQNILYIQNDEYEQCKKILNAFSCEDKINPMIKIRNLGSYLVPKYKQDIRDESFFPYGKDFTKSAFNYVNEDIDNDDEDLVTIDKNKAHSFMLFNLTRLLKVDVRFNKVKKVKDSNDFPINYSYLYVAVPEKSSILLPNTNIYTGSVLLLARKHNIKFTILEEQETINVPNYYKEFIADLYKKVDQKYAKDIINIIVGKFEKNPSITEYWKFVKIANNHEMQSSEDIEYTHQLNKEYFAGFKKHDSYNIKNKKPIAIQIKDQLRITLFQMINRLNIKENQVKQVKTDSITFKKMNDDYKKYINKELYGWKTEYFKAIKKVKVPINNPKLSLFLQNSISGELGLGYAGSGKTHKIINELIPRLKETYIVLTPSHATLEEYRSKNIKCDVIQSYYYKNEVPIAKNIIVDEIGMVDLDGWNILIKCKLKQKNIYAYGDQQQLLPYDKSLVDSPNFHNFMFANTIKLTENYRNNFTHDYYDYLMKLNDVELIKKEVLKHNTPYQDADVIIAYTNNTRNKYNKKMCTIHNIDSLTDIGAKIICTTNTLREYNIYNKFTFTVEDVADNIVYLSGGYKIPLKCFKNKNNFDYGYARTLFSVQGHSLNSFHYAMEDIKLCYNRRLYTLISRLKQKIVKKNVNKIVQESNIINFYKKYNTQIIN